MSRVTGGISVSPDQVFLWMDNYCQKAPLSDAIRGAEALLLMSERIMLGPATGRCPRRKPAKRDVRMVTSGVAKFRTFAPLA